MAHMQTRSDRRRSFFPKSFGPNPTSNPLIVAAQSRPERSRRDLPELPLRPLVRLAVPLRPQPQVRVFPRQLVQAQVGETFVLTHRGPVVRTLRSITATSRASPRNRGRVRGRATKLQSFETGLTSGSERVFRRAAAKV